MSNCIWLLRHGDTEWSERDFHTGRRDVPLSDIGRDQARAAARIVSDQRFDHVLVSPQTRAVETAQIAGVGSIASLWSDLVEWDYGEYEGLTDEQTQAHDPGWDLFRDGAPGGESPQQVSERVSRLLEKLDALEGAILLVGHGKLLRAFATRWLGCEISTAKLLPMDPAAICLLERERAGPLLRLWNLTPDRFE